MKRKWNLKTQAEELKYFITLLTNKIQEKEKTEETEKKANIVANEIYETIKEIDNAHKNSLSDPNSYCQTDINEIIESIAKKYHLNEDSFFKIFQDVTSNSNAKLDTIIKYRHNLDKSELTTFKQQHAEAGSRSRILIKISEFFDSLSNNDNQVNIEAIEAKNAQDHTGEDFEYEENLIRKAFETDLLSPEETALKRLMAVYIYIELCNDEKCKNIPLVSAIYLAISWVIRAKFLYQKQKNNTESLNIYSQKAPFVTVITLIRRAVKWFGVNKYKKSKTSDYIEQYKEGVRNLICGTFFELICKNIIDDKLGTVFDILSFNDFVEAIIVSMLSSLGIKVSIFLGKESLALIKKIYNLYETVKKEKKLNSNSYIDESSYSKKTFSNTGINKKILDSDNTPIKTNINTSQDKKKSKKQKTENEESE